MEKCYVTAVHKAGHHNNPYKNWPISVVPVIAKTLENCRKSALSVPSNKPIVEPISRCILLGKIN